MTATKAKNRSYVHEIYGLKETIVMILSNSLVQIWASMGKKKNKDKGNVLKTAVCNGLLLFFYFAPKLEISPKRHLILT